MTTSTYPATDRLKALYPNVGIHVLSEAEGKVKAIQTIGGKKLSTVLFRGCTRAEVEGNVLRLWHWEKTHKRLPLPFSITPPPVDETHDTSPALTPAPKLDTAPVEAAPVVVAPAPVRRPPGAGLHVNGGSKWVHHPKHGPKRIPAHLEADHLAAGWTKGRPKR